MHKQFLGIDISKDSFNISLLDSNEKIIFKTKLSMDKDRFLTFY